MAVRDNLPQWPVEAAFDCISGRWKPLIIWCIGYDKLRYSDIKTSLVPISPHILSRQLKSLENDGLIIRIQYQEVPLRVEYHLTPAGLELLPILGYLCGWASVHLPSRVSSPVRKNCRRFFCQQNSENFSVCSSAENIL
ncbi:helix-turn-helix domain-containing protein [Methanorbis rubei]|uniref:HTH hxlR-type domain-containing protein n=1 Tax=Methanorbis rubei TaxID=3028300 RepID=A0AAE4SAY6_9EURY|nr:hypothetical protein [Methanocorpusculaceae archaeon Cs1]